MSMWIKPPSLPKFMVPGSIEALGAMRTLGIVVEDCSGSVPGAPNVDRDFAEYDERFRGGRFFRTSGLEGPEIPERWQGTVLLGKMTGGKDDARQERRPDDPPGGTLPPASSPKQAAGLQMAGLWGLTRFPETNDAVMTAEKILSADAASNKERKVSTQAIARVVALFRDHMVQSAQKPDELEVAARIYSSFVSEYFAASEYHSDWKAVDDELAALIEIILDSSANQALRATIEELFKRWDLEADEAPERLNAALSATDAAFEACEPFSLEAEKQDAAFESAYHEMTRASWKSDGATLLAAHAYWMRLSFLHDHFNMAELLVEVLGDGQDLGHYIGPMADDAYELVQEDIAEVIPKALAAVRDHGENELEGILGRWMLELLHQQIPPPFRKVIGDEARKMAKSDRKEARARRSLLLADGARRLSKWF